MDAGNAPCQAMDGAGVAFSPNGELVAGLRVRCWASVVGEDKAHANLVKFRHVCPVGDICWVVV